MELLLADRQANCKYFMTKYLLLDSMFIRLHYGIWRLEMKILLAEDDRSLRRAVTVILEKNNYTVEAVDNGLDAANYAEIENYDAIIMDIMMPKMDGIEALKRIRGNFNNVPVILLTAKTEIEDRVSGLDSGANDYLTKPFDSRELLARVRVLTRAKQQVDSKLRLGNMTLDTNSCELSTESGKTILLNKEFQLLEMFMKNPDQIFSAEQMLNSAWDFESESDVTTVWTYISYLRRKLESVKSDYVIESKRNLGYHLVEKKANS